MLIIASLVFANRLLERTRTIRRGHGQPQYLHKFQEHESNENKGVLSIPVDILMLPRSTFSTWTCLVCPSLIFS
ncbi:hypothetical protein CMV_020177 [Castanea mollissima]|uniref:Uncharacterized protein n=1 Tax=Castanea mollissima TaxID=60419 RepID=A0A8J4QX02_9ROSI|nr:hypothetical protein CMV_020177 [Castanea mollissima]